ncbi:gliding motility-associated C-terminal domain-containing protein [Algibacter amylolyticus]|uniref:Gliding motility-associated C-terminal domain-containing protein n=1 Tax=Algibacter amylolyticus TaxID=1608400 RepID=A0A5M7B256_9FLAO|nr:gliding motility-associated C-terminal domain-containing protein [Algibacter amylolyticus]KAA5822307.1 gliding motility-associated C-terminal domain-containing protein [Algibacter amylolyticus]MBB5269020.1 gliding motility-associated-like protein [Algibacter amylolyticus]TSJ73457.1 gliding motility-associated C-terminal domain-containing protein [Algibacter amylolyticus]
MNTCFRNIFRFIFTSFIVFSSTYGIAQCAGTGSEITICDKETDPSLQAFNLFDQITGETPGGTWVADSNFNSDALDETAGIVNLWAINRFGAHGFTYMNSACDASTATVIINLGGYPGESNQNPGTNNVCQVLKADDDDAANIIDLFIFIDTANAMIGPDTGGVWTESPGNMATGLLSNEFFDFGNVPIGTYTFTYTVPSVNGCPSSSAIIDVEVRRSPNPGVTFDLNLCESDDMSGLRALDLFSRLTGEDTNGEWTDGNVPSTGELSNGSDSVINVENIYNTLGVGTYTFSYKVIPDHPICEEQEAVFTICIEEQLELTAALDVDCQGVVTVNYDSTLLANGTYNLSYTVTGSNLGTHTNAQDVDFANGNATFNLEPDLNLTSSETLTIQIDNITGPSPCGGLPLCTSIINVPPKMFDMFVEPNISITSTTGCELDDILITYLNTVDSNFNPIDGTQSVTYSINGVDFTDEVNFSNGNAVSNVSVDRFMLGSNQLVFYQSNSFVHCKDLNAGISLNLIPAPPNPMFSIVPDNKCDATSVQFGFNSPSGEFIAYNPVTFDIYQYGSEPGQFQPRDPSVSLTNNTQGDGIDLNISNTNDVSQLPDGDYVFVIRSVQDDNAACRGLSQTEIDNYTAQGIDVGLTKSGNNHIFDARLTFRIGEPPLPKLIKNNFQVCLLNGPVTLGDLSIFAGADVNIALTDINDVEVPETFEITEDATFNAVFTSTITGCDLGTEQLTVSVVSNASSPVLNTNVFCSLVTNTVSDLDTSGQDIVWYDAETDGTAYNTSDVIDTNNAYWAEITISGGCVSTTRTQAVITFVNQANAPTPLTNEFCSSATPTISDLKVETDAAIVQWFTSETGPEYTSTALPLDETQEYWVSQTAIQGCESERVQVTFITTDVAPNPEPITNSFCTVDGTVYTLENLNYNESSLSREGELTYFSDAAGTVAIPSTELLENVTSPVYVQQIIAEACSSAIVEVNFSLENRASKPELTRVTFCLENEPTIQELIDALETQTSNTITIYEDETTTTALDATLELSTLTEPIYASQTITAGCESNERTVVTFTLANPTISSNDFQVLHCSIDQATLNDVYFGNGTVVWKDESDNPLLGTVLLENGTSYFAQVEVESCLSEAIEIQITLVDVQDPIPSATTAAFCGIQEKQIADLLEDESGNARFITPPNHTLVWYDSNDVSTRNSLDNNTVLDNGTYYAVYEVTSTLSGQTITCESNAVGITVDLTACDPKELVIPDAFSPNGDSINDTFELLNIEFVYPDYNIEIYNRYGRVVFKGDIEVGFWDGKSNQGGFSSSEVLPTGVYFYVINFNRFGTKPYQGQVYLKR